MWLQLQGHTLLRAATITFGQRQRGNKTSAREHVLVHHPPRYSNTEGCEVYQMGVTHGAVITPRFMESMVNLSQMAGGFNHFCTHATRFLLQVTSVLVGVEMF